MFPFSFPFLLANRLLVHSLALVESVGYDGDTQYGLGRTRYDVRGWACGSLLSTKGIH